MRKFIKTLTVRLENGADVLIDKYMVKFEDPTLTGTLFKAPPVWLAFYYTKDHDEVEVDDDGAVTMSDGMTGRVSKNEA